MEPRPEIIFCWGVVVARDESQLFQIYHVHQVKGAVIHTTPVNVKCCFFGSDNKPGSGSLSQAPQPLALNAGQRFWTYMILSENSPDYTEARSLPGSDFFKL